MREVWRINWRSLEIKWRSIYLYWRIERRESDDDEGLDRQCKGYKEDDYIG